MTAAGIRDGKFIDPVMRRIRHDKDVEEVDTMATFREYEQVSLVALERGFPTRLIVEKSSR